MSIRTSGVLLHITSLANDYPIGDLGPAAYAFVDFLRGSGQTYWQMLPIGPTGMMNSPYDGPAAFAGNPLLISPDQLVKQGLLLQNDLLPLPASAQRVDYTVAWRWKEALLRKAFARYQAQSCQGGGTAFDDFITKECYWLQDYALYAVLCEQQKTANWTTWPDALRTRQVDALANIQQDLANEIKYYQFVQWQFALQWDELKGYCHQNEVRLIGDIPLFVSHQSADVWAHPVLFKLNEQGLPITVAGVPPDYFSKTGQLWNVPVYCWEALKQQHFGWWLERVTTLLNRFDVIRLDHFIGFVRTYEIPAQATTALKGQYQASDGLDLLLAVQQKIGCLPFIAEDLGAKTPEVDQLREQLCIPGMRVLQFELTDDSAPPEDRVIYTGTHDNNTLIGWYQSLNDSERTQLLSRLEGNHDEINWALICQAFESNAQMAIVPMQDLLGLGSEARMNLPGTGQGNWQWRLTTMVFAEALIERLHQLTRSTGRYLVN